MSKNTNKKQEEKRIHEIINANFNKVINNIAESENIDPSNLLESYVSNLNSKNEIIRANGEKKITKIIDSITFMSLKQSIQDDFETSREESFNAQFQGEELNEGNSISLVLNLTTGTSNYIGTEFIPTYTSNPKNEVQTFNLYKNANQELEENAFQIRKSFTSSPSEWIPYFTSGNLSTFISMNVSKLKKSFDLYLYNKNINLITTETNYSKKITGTAADLFLAFTTEINVELLKMRYGSSEYNLSDTSKGINSTKKEDILILCNTATFAKLTSGVLTQLPNAQLFNLEVDNNNVFNPGFKYQIPNETGGENIAISVLNEEYVPENKIFVIDKNALVNHFQVKKSGAQGYDNNIVVQHVIHIWGLAGLINWGKGFVYTNDNLAILPGTNSTPALVTNNNIESNNIG